MNTELVKELVEQGLMGQAVRHAGYELCNPAVQLKVEEIQRLEDQQTIAEATAKMIAQGYRVVEPDMQETNLYLHCTKGLFRSESIHWFSRKVCRVQFDPVTLYSQTILPSNVLACIQHCLAQGINTHYLYVAYPVVEEVKQDDPILVIKLTSNTHFLVTQWD